MDFPEKSHWTRAKARRFDEALERGDVSRRLGARRRRLRATKCVVTTTADLIRPLRPCAEGLALVQQLTAHVGRPCLSALPTVDRGPCTQRDVRVVRRTG